MPTQRKAGGTITSQAQHVVGIDLGTTHCAISTARIAQPSVHRMKVPQLVAPGEIAERGLLPSFTYLPAKGEFAARDLTLPWSETSRIVGELARRLGAKAPDRLVLSAKSWVCHGGVNRRAPILPWNAPHEEDQISPFEAQAGYLSHLRHAWEMSHPGSRLAEQDVVVTVPASFDEGARELTTEAAKDAGLGEVRLLEEPQAAFYDYLGEHSDAFPPGSDSPKLILVVDVGGGTTDLTLLHVKAAAGEADVSKIERIAVGGHLMLGGDNMDAALAIYALEKAKLERPQDATIWSALVQSAGRAKEHLLGVPTATEAVISYTGRGSRLIGNTCSITIRREEAHRVLLDGFLPASGPTEVAQKTSRVGLTTLGLPYTSDAAIPRHICAFLRRHVDAATDAKAQIFDGLPRPDLLLLNGGVFKAQALVERLTNVLARWYGGEAIPLLDHSSLDTAVASGAVRSGLARRGLGERIGGGTARAYYIGVQSKCGMSTALCVAPRGMQDGASVSVPDRVFKLVLGRPVSFQLYAYTGDRTDASGTTVDPEVHGDAFESLPPLATLIRAQTGATTATQDRDTVHVTLRATLTDTGALELYLVTLELPPARWRLDFTMRSREPVVPDLERAASSPGTPTHVSAHPHSVSADPSSAQPLSSADTNAQRTVQHAFAERSNGLATAIRRDLEKTLGARGMWSATTCRALWDACIRAREHRGQSEVHELNWLRLCGWCLRPGFGAPGDEDRLLAMDSVHCQGLLHPSKANWAEWWILWRRVAAGLDAARQQRLFADIQPWLWKRGPPPAGPHAHGAVEMMQLLAALERLDETTKCRAGELFFERAKKIGSYWPVGRVGARQLLHAQTGDIVRPGIAEDWLARLLALDWNAAEGAAFAAASVATLTGDVARDVAAPVRSRVTERLRQTGAAATWIDMVIRPSGRSDADTKRMFGDSLPPGLRLT
ncbi:MAG: Hsp70 family protein [Nannocystaceae bacterium]